MNNLEKNIRIIISDDHHISITKERGENRQLIQQKNVISSFNLKSNGGTR